MGHDALGSQGELAWTPTLESSLSSKADRQRPAVVTQDRAREYTGVREVGTGLLQDRRAVRTKESKAGRQDHWWLQFKCGYGDTIEVGCAGPPQPCQAVGSLFSKHGLGRMQSEMQ